MNVWNSLCTANLPYLVGREPNIRPQSARIAVAQLRIGITLFGQGIVRRISRSKLLVELVSEACSYVSLRSRAHAIAVGVLT